MGSDGAELTEAEAASLSGIDVVGADDAPVGRVRDVYRTDRTGAVAALAVTRGKLSTRTVLVPTAAIDLPTPHDPEHERTAPIRLLVPARAAREGQEPPATGHLTPEELRAAERGMGIEEAPQG